MIDKSKQYRTRDGREVRIYATDGVGDYPVHGSVKCEDGWRSRTWTNGGSNCVNGVESSADLIEVRPRIKRKVWMNVYESFDRLYYCKKLADIDSDGLLECKLIEIDIEVPE